MKVILDFISVDERLPEVEGLTSKPVLFIADGKIHDGYYRANGCFYSGDFAARTMEAEKQFSPDRLPYFSAHYWMYKEGVL